MSDYKSPLHERPEVPDYVVCTCMGVMYSEIVEAIEKGAHSVEALSDLLMTSTGCSSCLPEVKEILRDKVRQ